LRLWLGSVLVAVVAVAGCAPAGEVVSVSISPAPAIANVARIEATAVVVGGDTQSATFNFGSRSTPIVFALAFPSGYVGKMVSVSAHLFDASNKDLGTVEGTTTIAKGSHQLVLGAPCVGDTNAPLCENFENNFARFWKGGGPIFDGGHMSIDSTRAKRGSSSVHIQTDAVPNNGFVFADLLENIFAPDTVFIRAFVWVPKTFDPTTAAIFLFEQDGGKSLQIALNLDTQTIGVFGGLDGHTNLGSKTLPTDQWACIEWSVTVGNPGAYTAWINDEQVMTASNVKTKPDSPEPPFKAVAVGLGSSINAPREIWMDEVRISNQRIGCDQ
jgi:hypothetical protein